MCAQKTTPLNLARRHNAFSLTLRPANCDSSGSGSSSDFVSMLVVGHVRGVGVVGGGGDCEEGKEVIYWACICVCVCVCKCVCVCAKRSVQINIYVHMGDAVCVSALQLCVAFKLPLFFFLLVLYTIFEFQLSLCQSVCLLFAFAAFAINFCQLSFVLMFRLKALKLGIIGRLLLVLFVLMSCSNSLSRYFVTA